MHHMYTMLAPKIKPVLNPNPRIRILHPYQAEGVRVVLDSDDDILFDWATAAGKTTEAVVIAYMLLTMKKCWGVVVATTQRHIEGTFTNRDFDGFIFSDNKDCATLPHIIPKSFMRTAGDNNRRKRTSSYLQVATPQKYAIVGTHQCLKKELLPESLVGRVLIIDEAQHTSTDDTLVLSSVIKAWRERGGRVIYFTGTAFRNDKVPVAFDDMKWHRRPLALQMDEGYAPHKLNITVVPIVRGGAVTLQQFQGEAPPSDLNIKSTAQLMIKSARPGAKTIARVPAMRDGASKEFIQELMLEAKKHKLRAFDASGIGKDIQQDFQNVLDSERTRSYAESEWDYIAGIKRVEEGTDWVQCSDLQIYGIPKSCTIIIQIIGRGVRKKREDHPHAESTNVTFFVEMGDSDAAGVFCYRNSQDMLALCVLLADLQNPSRWFFEREFQKIVEEEVNDERLAREFRMELDARPAVENVERGEFLVALNSLLDTKQGGDIEIGEAYKALQGILPSSAEDTGTVIKDQLVQAIYDSRTSDSDRERFRKVMRAVAKGIAHGFPASTIRETLNDAVVQEFRKETMTAGPLLKGFEAQTHSLSGSTMMQWCEKICGKSPISESLIRELGEEFKSAHKRWPTKSDGNLCLPEGETWKGYDVAARGGFRGMPGGSSLAKIFGYADRHNQSPRSIEALVKMGKTGGTAADVSAKLGYKVDHGVFSQAIRCGLIEKMPNSIPKATRYRVTGAKGATGFHSELDIKKYTKILTEFHKRKDCQFTAAELGAKAGTTATGTSPILRSLKKRGCVEKVASGVWVVINPGVPERESSSSAS
jgi:superfamily II DNA or RNA helicase